MEIYKYLSEESSVKFLENWCIAFQQPDQFNDPFDCLPSFVGVSEEERATSIQRLASEYMRIQKFPTIEENEAYAEYFFDWQERSHAGEARMYIPSGLFFVSCFSRTETNLLMWSHYASKHNGIVVEFDRLNPIFQNLRSVTYSQKRPRAGASQTMATLSQVQDFYFAKSIDWAYEQEERIVLNRESATKLQEESGFPEISQKLKLAKVGKSSVRSIYFSNNFLHSHKDEIAALKSDPDSKGIGLYRAIIDSKEYKIHALPISR